MVIQPVDGEEQEVDDELLARQLQFQEQQQQQADAEQAMRARRRRSSGDDYGDRRRFVSDQELRDEALARQMVEMDLMGEQEQQQNFSRGNDQRNQYQHHQPQHYPPYHPSPYHQDPTDYNNNNRFPPTANIVPLAGRGPSPPPPHMLYEEDPRHLVHRSPYSNNSHLPPPRLNVVPLGGGGGGGAGRTSTNHHPYQQQPDFSRGGNHYFPISSVSAPSSPNVVRLGAPPPPEFQQYFDSRNVLPQQQQKQQPPPPPSEESDFELAIRMQAEEEANYSKSRNVEKEQAQKLQKSPVEKEEDEEQLADERLAQLMAATGRSLRDLSKEELEEYISSYTFVKKEKKGQKHPNNDVNKTSAAGSMDSRPNSPMDNLQKTVGKNDETPGQQTQQNDPHDSNNNSNNTKKKKKNPLFRHVWSAPNSPSHDNTNHNNKRATVRSRTPPPPGKNHTTVAQLPPPPSQPMEQKPASRGGLLKMKPPPNERLAASTKNNNKKPPPSAIPPPPSPPPLSAMGIPAAIPPPPRPGGGGGPLGHGIGGGACTNCGLTEGTFLKAKDRLYHPECFRCAACNEKIDLTSKFAFRKGDTSKQHTQQHASMNKNGNSLVPYHATCLPRDPKHLCVVCKQVIPPGTDGMVLYVKHPFFRNERMCPHHAASAVRRCTGCHRFEPVDEPFADLDDAGRCVCLACCRTVVTNEQDMQPLWEQVLNFFEQKMQLPIPEEMRQIPVLCVCYEDLQEQLAALSSSGGGKKHSHRLGGGSGGGQIMAQGLCLTDVDDETGGGPGGRRCSIRMPSLRFNWSSSSFEALDEQLQGFKYYHNNSEEDHHHRNRTKVWAILCVSGLPRDLTASILAHEATHAWLKLHPDSSNTDQAPLDPQVEEGVAQLVTMLFLNEGLEPIVPTDEGGGGEQRKNNNTSTESKPINTVTCPTDEELRQYFKFCIESEEHEIFGKGYHKAAHAYREVGIQPLLTHVALNGTFPET